MDTCSKCGSDRMMADVRLLDRADNLSVNDLTAEVYEHPDAFFFKGAAKATLRARICGSCGFCELYAGDPAALWQAYCVSLGQKGSRPSAGLPVVDGPTEAGPSASDS